MAQVINKGGLHFHFLFAEEAVVRARISRRRRHAPLFFPCRRRRRCRRRQPPLRLRPLHHGQEDGGVLHQEEVLVVEVGLPGNNSDQQ